MREGSTPRVTLTQTARQPYSVYCLTGKVFKEVQLGNANNMKMMPKNISGPLSLAHPNVCIGPELVPSTAVFERTSTLVITKQHSNTTSRLCTTKSANIGKLGISVIQHAKYNQLPIAPFHGLRSLVTSISISSQSQLSRVHMSRLVRLGTIVIPFPTILRYCQPVTASSFSACYNWLAIR